MTVSFTHTAEQRTEARFAADILSSNAPTATVVRGVRHVQSWKADGATDADIASILDVPKRRMETIAKVARLAKMVKSDENPDGILEVGTLLQDNGATTSLRKPAGLLKDMEKHGKTFATWAAARKHLEGLLAAQNPTSENDDTEGEDTEGEESIGGDAGGDTAESLIRKAVAAAFKAATDADMDLSDAFDIIADQWDGLTAAATISEEAAA